MLPKKRSKGRESTQFKTGNPGGPGRPKKSKVQAEADAKYTEKINELKKFKRKDIVDSLFHYLDVNIADLQTIFETARLPARDMIVISIIVDTIKRGDVFKMQWIMDKMFGKEADKLQIEQKVKDFSGVSKENLRKARDLLVINHKKNDG